MEKYITLKMENSMQDEKMWKKKKNREHVEKHNKNVKTECMV